RGLSSPPDVLSFEGREHLSQPFCYDIQFTSRDKTLEPEAVLMQDGALSLCAPPVQGMPVQIPLRTLYGIRLLKHTKKNMDLNTSSFSEEKSFGKRFFHIYW
ncbi:hypothetical protein DFO55_10726, partial [Grimontella sp. AG753]